MIAVTLGGSPPIAQREPSAPQAFLRILSSDAGERIASLLAREETRASLLAIAKRAKPLYCFVVLSHD